MSPRTLSEQWEAARLHLNRFRSWLGTSERTHSLLLLLWPLVALVIAVLAIQLMIAIARSLTSNADYSYCPRLSAASLLDQ
jgi:hypothetical protein